LNRMRGNKGKLKGGGETPCSGAIPFVAVTYYGVKFRRGHVF
jgi:hypothetical protein